MIKRYGLTGVFNDPDFDMEAKVDTFFTHEGALYEYWKRESARRNSREADTWHWIVIDRKTGEDLTPRI